MSSDPGTRNEDLEVRLAGPSDAEAVGRIRVRARQAAYRSWMPAAYLDALDPGSNLEELRARLAPATADFSVLLASLAARPAGFAIVAPPRYASRAGVAELWALNVDPDAWRRGVGAALVEAVARRAGEQGLGRLAAWCIAGNRPARRLYEKLEFVGPLEERTTTALTGLPLHEVLYAKPLEAPLR